MPGESEYTVIIIWTTSVLLLLSGFVITFVVLYKTKQARFASEKQQFKEVLALSQLEIREQTLAEISRDVHDNLGLIASLIKINLITLPFHDVEQTKKKIEETKDLTRQLIADIKSIARGLSGDSGDIPSLDVILRTAIERVNNISELEVIFQSAGYVENISPEIKTILYRISQEIINNVVKHSQATRFQIMLHTDKDVTFLSFQDNGVGFDLEKEMLGIGSGLKNIHERIRLIKGNVKISSNANSGTSINVEVF